MSSPGKSPRRTPNPEPPGRRAMERLAWKSRAAGRRAPLPQPSQCPVERQPGFSWPCRETVPEAPTCGPAPLLPTELPPPVWARPPAPAQRGWNPNSGCVVAPRGHCGAGCLGDRPKQLRSPRPPLQGHRRTTKCSLSIWARSSVFSKETSQKSPPPPQRETKL